MKKLVVAILSVSMLLTSVTLFAGGARADRPFPSRDITIFLGQAAGGGNDLTVRALIPSLERTLGVSVVPINNTAGRGAVAFTEVSNARPDGYRLFFHSKSVLLMRYAGIDEARIERLTPVAQVAEDVAIFLVRYDSPWRNMNDLISHLRTSPARVRTGNSGMGQLWHLSQILFEQTIGTDNILPVQYGGSTPMLVALVAGEIELAVTGPEAITFIESGQLRPLAVVYPTRYPSLPDIPTLYEETGYSFDFPVWRGFFTTAGTDPETVRILANALEIAVQSEEFRRFTATGMIGYFRGPQEFGQVVDAERRRLEVMMPGVMARIQQ